MIKNHKIALFGNSGDKKATIAAELVHKSAELHKIEVVETDEYVEGMTLAVCLGGDGTFLDVASKVGGKDVPVVGINTGHMGFLANYSVQDIEQLFDDIVNENYNVSERSVLHLSSPDITFEGHPYALNEVAILKHDIASMISIRTEINGDYLTTYQADGLIVGTPTGSTAYSLSVGGPVIVPALDAITLAPVAPHSLNMRPVVIDGKSEVKLTIRSRSGNFLISLDGRSRSFADDITVCIRKAPYTIKVISRKDSNFFTTLREKLMWGKGQRE